MSGVGARPRRGAPPPDSHPNHSTSDPVGVTSVSQTKTPEHVDSSDSSIPVSKPPSLSVGALAVGIFMILVFVGVIGLIVAVLDGFGVIDDEPQPEVVDR